MYKYLAANARDLGGAKHGGLADNNFDSVENFIEYEKFLGGSYFVSVIVEFVERSRHMVAALSS